MAVKEVDQLNYYVGVDDILFTMMTTEDTFDSEPVYDTDIVRVPTVRKIGMKPNTSGKDVWASNKLFDSVKRTTKEELSLTHVALPVDLVDKMENLEITEGVSFENSMPKKDVYFAVGIIFPLSNGGFELRWYPKVKLEVREEEGETLEEEADIKDVSISMTAVPLKFNGNIKGRLNSTRKSYTSITQDDYLKQVIYDKSQLEELVKPKRADK